jgi:hypothetical protein
LQQNEERPPIVATTTETKVVITGDSKGAVSAIQQLNTAMGGMESIASKITGIFGAVAGTAGIAYFTNLTKSVLENAASLADLSEKTGISVENLSRLQYVAAATGTNFDTLSKGIGRLQKQIYDAAKSTEDAPKSFERYGISVRDAAGKIRPTIDVLTDLAGVFEVMPNGAEKASLAVDLFGKKVSGDMLLALNAGKEGMRALFDEADALGIVIGGKLASEADQFNESLGRLSRLSAAAGISIGNSLMPRLNELASGLVDLRTSGAVSGAGIFARLFGQDFDTSSKTAAQNLENTRRKIAELTEEEKTAVGIRKQAIALLIEGQQQLEKFWDKQAQRESGSGSTDAEIVARRILLQGKLNAELAKLDKLRAISSGQADAEILLSDEKRIQAQIKSAEKLRDALRSAWQETVQAAKAAGDEAAKLLQSAGDKRQSGADKATDIRRSQLSPEEQLTANQADYQRLSDNASESANLAKLAALQGRTQAAAKLAEQASKDAERAARLVDKLGTPEAQASAAERIGEVQATADEAKAAIKLKEQKDLTETAANQAVMLKELDKQITDLQTKAASIAVKVDIADAESSISSLQAKLDALQDKTITVTVNQVTSSDMAKFDAAAAASGYAWGGWTGPGSKFQPAGIVHANEFVTRSEIVNQRGALAFLQRFNREGMRALPGFASGGLVGSLNIPQLSAPAAQSARAAAIFNFPGMGSYQVSMMDDAFARLQVNFQRIALQKGGRR